MSARVLLVDEVGDLGAVRAVLGDGAEQARALPVDRDAGRGVVGVLAGTEVVVGPAQLAALPDLRIAAATATGFDHLDLEAIAAAGAWATHCPGYCDDEVADTAIAMALDLLRGVTLLDRSMRAGRYDHRDVPGRRIAGATLGIIGLGRIGRAVAARGRALGMRVLAFDPYVADAVTPLPELLAQSDVVTLHMLLTDETRHLIGARELAIMRSDGYLVNCARADLIDHAALGEALRGGHLGGCALDVLGAEPPADDEPALRWPRTIVNPHAAWYSPASESAPYRIAAQAVAAVLAGREPEGALVAPGGQPTSA